MYYYFQKKHAFHLFVILYLQDDQGSGNLIEVTALLISRVYSNVDPRTSGLVYLFYSKSWSIPYEFNKVRISDAMCI